MVESHFKKSHILFILKQKYLNFAPKINRWNFCLFRRENSNETFLVIFPHCVEFGTKNPNLWWKFGWYNTQKNLQGLRQRPLRMEEGNLTQKLGLILRLAKEAYKSPYQSEQSDYCDVAIKEPQTFLSFSREANQISFSPKTKSKYY